MANEMSAASSISVLQHPKGHAMYLTDDLINACKVASKTMQKVADGRLVEVVKCGDCERKPKCDIYKFYGTDKFSCSHGERKGSAADA